MKCPNCGETSRIRKQDRFCHKCGASLKEGQTTMEEKIKEAFSSRMIGYESPPGDAQHIVDVITVLASRNITVSRAIRILTDAEKIVPLITMI